MSQKPSRFNVPIALASLIISLLLWFVLLPQHLTTGKWKFNIPLHQTGLNSEFSVVDAPPSIVVTALVSEDEYKRIIDHKPYAEVDLSLAKQGKNVISPISIYPPELQQKVSEGGKSVTVTLEHLGKNDAIVIATPTGKLSDPSLILDELEVETKHVSIEGLDSDIARVNKVVATVGLDMIDPHAPQPVEVILNAFDASDHLVPNVTIHPAKVFVKPKLALSPQTKQVFVQAEFLGKVPDGFVVQSYSVEPDRITASGPSRILKGITKLATEPIDVSQLTGTQTLTAPIQVPAGLSGVDTREVKVTITIQPATVKGLSPSDSASKSKSRQLDGANGHPL